jgi:endonuclease/exonuclease/phosphatase (EEP) superfamily protein YafD
VLSGRADTAALAALVDREAPDLLVLPEAGRDFLDKLLPLLGPGHRGWAATPPGVGDIMGVVLVAGPGAGDLRVEPEAGMHYRGLRATGGVLGRRALHAVHTTAPRTRRLAALWRRDLALIGGWTREDPAPLVVGDLNATLDHALLRAALGGCRSAARGPLALAGTFPSGRPRWVGVHIDHVLVPAGAATDRFAVLDVAGSDHRAVLARVRLPA